MCQYGVFSSWLQFAQRAWRFVSVIVSDLSSRFFYTNPFVDSKHKLNFFMKQAVNRCNRQTIKTITVTLLFAVFILPLKISAQEEKSKIDYSVKSNILNPDTLKADQKRIFYHPYFLKLTHEETKNLEPFKVKDEFEKLGITLKEDARFGRAYIFFDTSMKNHKKSVENWESFKDLAPKN
jgi:hypothetical protein